MTFEELKNANKLNEEIDDLNSQIRSNIGTLENILKHCSVREPIVFSLGVRNLGHMYFVGNDELKKFATEQIEKQKSALQELEKQFKNL